MKKCACCSRKLQLQKDCSGENQSKRHLTLEDNTKKYDEEEKILPVRSRILASADGLEKIISIDKTLERYSKINPQKKYIMV